jgi:hypothetical protein
VPKHKPLLRKLRLHSLMRLPVLPSLKLQHLSLHDCDLGVINSSNVFSNSISTATALTSLHIPRCVVRVPDHIEDAEAAATGFLSPLASLTDLQELSVCGVKKFVALCPGSQSVQLLLPTTVLQQLQHLTQLCLQAKGMAGDMMQHIGTMTNLRTCGLAASSRRPPRMLSVTHLAPLTQLRWLGLRGVRLDHGSRQQAAAKAAAMLAWLPTLQDLTCLQLAAVEGLHDNSQGRELYPPAAAYRALTAGSSLQHIDLRGTQLSQNAWQRAFPLVQKLTGITCLQIGDHSWHPTQQTCFFFDFAVGSCPNLQELQRDSMREISDWQLLQQISSLTRLTVSPTRHFEHLKCRFRSAWAADTAEEPAAEVSEPLQYAEHG